MNKLIRLLVLPIALSTGVALLPGCGGSNSAPIINTTPAPFAGTYNGTFQGTTTPASGNAGQPVNGSFIGTLQSDGTVTGFIQQPGLAAQSLTGKVDSAGNLTATTTPIQGQTAVLNGRITLASGSSTAANFVGTFTTTANGTAVVTGTATGSRTSTSTATQ